MDIWTGLKVNLVRTGGLI